MNSRAFGPDELDAETREAARLASRSIREYLKGIDLVSESYLSQVLIALWDSGIYEYVRRTDGIDVPVAAEELGLDPTILTWLLDYVVGRGLFAREGDRYVITDKGRPYWNFITRGVLTAHVGGYNQLITNLGPLLRGEVGLYDSSIRRDGRLVARGAGFTLVGSATIPWILSVIRDLGGRRVMDFGCGAGDFLIQLAWQWTEGRGLGIDMNADAIAEASQAAQEAGVADRVQFHQAMLSREPMQLPAGALDDVDTITAMYVLHELGRDGVDAITEVVALLRQQFPGRKLLLAEGSPADPEELGKSPQRTYSHLDYSWLHPISGQGPLRSPKEWEQIIQRAGARLIERIPGFNMVPAWISLYVVGLD